MTLERIVFDTTAWFEVFAGNPAGKRLSRDYLDSPEVRVMTPSLALAEMSAKMARRGAPRERIASAIHNIQAASEVVELSVSAAIEVGPLLVELRRSEDDASMADAVMLATARDHAATLVSTDRAFNGQRDVRRP